MPLWHHDMFARLCFLSHRRCPAPMHPIQKAVVASASAAFFFALKGDPPMKVTASYMAAYLLALYYCSKDDKHAPEDAVKFALNRYISDSCKEDAQVQLQEACDESDDLGYTEEYGDGPRTLTARGLDQINAAAMQKGDYVELIHSDTLDVDNWIDDYVAATED